MTGLNTELGSLNESDQVGSRLIDPRCGDIEDDFASPGQRSLLAIAARLLVEISLPKLLFAWTMSLLLPAVLLGLAPLVAATWLTTVSTHIVKLTEFGAATLVFVAMVALGWLGWRPLWRIAEENFWSLNALVVQPGYVFSSELLRHLAERTFARHWTDVGRARLRATSSAAAGVIVCGCAAAIIALVWPSTRWVAAVSDVTLRDRTNARQRCCPGVGLSRDRLARVGFCGCEHGSAVRSPSLRCCALRAPELAYRTSFGPSRRW